MNDEGVEPPTFKREVTDADAGAYVAAVLELVREVEAASPDARVLGFACDTVARTASVQYYRTRGERPGAGSPAAPRARVIAPLLDPPKPPDAGPGDVGP